MRFFNILLLLQFISLISFSQTEPRQLEVYSDTTTNYIELSGMGSTTGRTPFWLEANQFGTVPRTAPSGTARAGLEHYWTLSEGKNRNVWRVGVGVEGVANLTENSKFLLPQAHATLRFKNWELFVGRKKQWLGLADSTLGSGSYAWSGNALPIPKIQFGTTRFVPVPFTKKWLNFQAFYSDGIFEKNRPITSGLKFHQKSLYVRIGRDHSLLKLYGGFNHQVQWGGKSPYLTNDSNNLPDGFSNYLYAVTGALGGAGDNVTHFDSTNRIGNHLGSIDAAIEINTYDANIFLYRQFVYEDGSLFYMTTLDDGLYGARFRRKNSYGSNFELSEAVFEVLFTKNQGGDIFLIGNGKFRGHDNYFNNQQVRDGWSYFDRTIGTPFIPPTSQTRWRWPNYADNFTSNNRVLLFHFGLKGKLFRAVDWTTKLSFSSNSGSYLERFEGSPKQFSGLIGLQSKLDVMGGIIIRGAYSADLGDLYPDAHGFMLGLRKDLSF